MTTAIKIGKIRFFKERFEEARYILTTRAPADFDVFLVAIGRL